MWLFHDKTADDKGFRLSERHFRPTTTVVLDAVTPLKQFCSIAAKTTF